MDKSGREFLDKEWKELKGQFLMNDSNVQTVIGIENGRCNRCLNEDLNYFHQFMQAEKLIIYCRKCIDFGMVTNETALYRIPKCHQIKTEVSELNKDFELSFLQEKASNFSKEILAKRETAIIWAVCGAGKTEMMFESISQALAANMRVCWAIPRADVVIDLTPRIKQAFPNAKVVCLHGNSDEKADYGDIVVTTVHQMIRFYEAFDFLIIDEVDAFPYTFDEMLVRIAKRATTRDGATIYLSATPSKADQTEIKNGALKSYIIPARYHLYPLDVPTYKWCPKFQQKVAKNKLPRVALKWIEGQIRSERRTLLFVPTVKTGHHFKKALKSKLNLEVDFVYSSDEGRSEKVARFKDGQGQFLITTMILERGVTIPNIDVAVFASEHQVYEESALVQISGRVGRNPKWPTGDVVFFHFGMTQAMEDAVKQIKDMNANAKAQGLLKEVAS